MKKIKEKLVGKVIHYFDKLKVAVIRVSAPVSVGDKIRIVGGEDTNFKQTIKSIESDHKKLKRAGKGKEVGIKVNNKVREGYKVFKI
ncbi:MAG: hypothetical protein Q8N69_03455 [bacterium]|nr:hypothetical protein [bacterium]